MRNSVKYALITATLAGPVIFASSAMAQVSSYEDLFGNALKGSSKEQTQEMVTPTVSAEEMITEVVDKDFIGPQIGPIQFGQVPAFQNIAPATLPVRSNASDIEALRVETEALLGALSERLSGGDDGESVNLESIDDLNRKKALLKQRNEIDALKLEALKSQVDMMLLLEATQSEIRKMRAEALVVPSKATDTSKLSAVEPDKKKKEEVDNDIFAQQPPADWSFTPQMPEIPRIAEVVGGAGEITAYGDFIDGRRITLRQGDVMTTGLVVREVRPTGVRLEWPATGEIVFANIGPRNAPQVQNAPFTPGGSIPLGTFGQ